MKGQILEAWTLVGPAECDMGQLSLERALNAAREASAEGARVIHSFFGKIDQVQEKPDTSIVSQADQESERAIRKILSREYPEFSFHGEEGGLISQAGSRGTWYVDPLDGTTNFVHAFPYYSTSIALEYEGEVVVAAVDAPSLGFKIWASKGGGAYWNDRKICVSRRKEIEECLFVTGFGYEKPHHLQRQVAIFAHFQGLSRGVRRPGGAALDLCFTAAGVFDAFWERFLKPWDTAAGSLIIREAGGLVTDMEGKPWNPLSPSILAGSPPLHHFVLNELAKIR